ncbi:nickel/cobalt transporter [Yersinia hibernica]|uniref:Nickel/cobalt efflux system n=1 Tax=Yersinia hibernica TaxID=2339259 RepID=A0ABX5R437_9GAMM|nr:nickel transporter [Yersinia hibernica]QAX80076.1 nickel transporter [Yersinia hibernica]
MPSNLKLSRANMASIGFSSAILLSLLWIFARHWADFVQYCINFQIYMHRYLVLYLLKQQNNQTGAGLMLALFSFIYGFLHSIGPGHGKFVITTYLATSREKVTTSRLITFLGSLMQGLVAIAFVVILGVIFNLSMGELSLSRFYVEKASALFIVLFGLVLILRASGIRPFMLFRRQRQAVISHIGQPLATKPTQSILAAPSSHQHTEDCACRHMPSAEQLNGGWKTYLWVIASIGIRPCSGAILILVFANAIGMFTWGIIAAMSMALGTALSIMIIATLVYHAREKLISINSQILSGQLIHAAQIAMLIGGVLLILFGLVLFSSVIPISANGDFIAAGC